MSAAVEMPRADFSAAERAALFVLSGFGAGYTPFAQGTFGSAVGAAIYVGLALAAPAEAGAIALALAAVYFAITWRFGDLAERVYGEKDPSQVVSDEVGGYLVTAALLGGLGLGLGARTLFAFLAFRLFDIWKPWPVRRFESLPGGLGIAADDYAAALLAAGSVQALVRAWSSFGGRG